MQNGGYDWSFDELVVSGTGLWLFTLVPVQERADLLKDKDKKEEVATKKFVIKNALGSLIVRRNLRVLATVDVNGSPRGQVITIDNFYSILILSDTDAPDTDAPDTVTSDSLWLASLLLVQDLQAQNRCQKDEEFQRWP